MGVVGGWEVTNMKGEGSPGKLGQGGHRSQGWAPRGGWRAHIGPCVQQARSSKSAPRRPTCAGSLSPSSSFTLVSSCLM